MSKPKKYVKLTMAQVIQLFHERIMHEVIRSFGDRGYEDAYQDLVIAISEKIWDKKPTMCRHNKRILPIDPAHVIIFIKHRVIDMVRHARVGARSALPLSDLEYEIGYQSPTRAEQNENLDALIGVLRRALTATELEIVLTKAFPPDPVVAMAERDRVDAEEDRRAGVARLHFKQATVRDRHIAAFTNTSPASVSRALSKARQAIEGAPK